jgi:RND family efflux transporter MFP subunit
MVADLSRVWVIADVFEYEASGVRLGMPATLTLSYLPGRTFRGKVNYILPQVDAATRTLKVRIEFPNADFALKPDMYGEVEFQTGGGRRLVVPQTAVLNSGDRQVVFVDRGKGYFEPREVKLGGRSEGRVEILSGLQPGERIVVSGNFLIDSESQLKTSLGGASK